VFVEDFKVNYNYEEKHPLVNEFSTELIDDNTVFEKAMSDLYLSPKASKYLDNYTEFDRRSLVEHAENL
jgi:exonuclease SbcD